jgi:hypothetical protein
LIGILSSKIDSAKGNLKERTMEYEILHRIEQKVAILEQKIDQLLAALGQAPKPEDARSYLARKMIEEDEISGFYR